MKTAEEIIQDMVDEMPFYMHERAKPYIYEAMKIYSKQCAEQALKDAAERATMTFHDGHFKTNNPTKHHQMGADNLQVNRESILSTPILTP